ncbi:MAG: DUF2232 domain-containing protein [Nitrospiraceae bacterium]|nr:DUF2232 domain-containing protein [Nitrospiraceae bacterium]
MPFRPVIIAALQSAGLCALGLFPIPIISQIALLFSPVPLILVHLREGRRAAVLAIILASLLMAALGGWHVALLVFFLSLGTMALAIAESMARGHRPEQAVILGGALPVFLIGSLLALLFLKAGKDPLSAAEAFLRNSLTEAKETYAKIGLGDVAQALSFVSDSVIHYFVRLIPGIILATSLIQSAACYGMARSLIIRRTPGSPLAQATPLALWQAPDQWVWGLIVTLILVAWGTIDPAQTTAFFVGLNLVLLYLLVYLAQGVALVEYLLRKVRVPAVWRGFLHTIILALPSIVAVIALGVVDIWADFRKVRRSTAS